jgi:hypothetical protein
MSHNTYSNTLPALGNVQMEEAKLEMLLRQHERLVIKTRFIVSDYAEGLITKTAAMEQLDLIPDELIMLERVIAAQERYLVTLVEQGLPAAEMLIA